MEETRAVEARNVRLENENKILKSHIGELKNIILQFKELVDLKGINIPRSLSERIKDHAPETFWPSTPSSNTQQMVFLTLTSSTASQRQATFPPSIPPAASSQQLNDNAESLRSFQTNFDLQPDPMWYLNPDNTSGMNTFLYDEQG